MCSKKDEFLLPHGLLSLQLLLLDPDGGSQLELLLSTRTRPRSLDRQRVAKPLLQSGESSRERELAPPSRALLLFPRQSSRMWIALWLFCRLEQGGYSEGLATRTDALEDLQTDYLVRCNLHIQRAWVWVQSVSLQEDIQVRSVLVQHRWTTLTEGSQLNHMQQYLQAHLFCQNFRFSFFLALHLSCLVFDCFALQSFPEIFQLETLYNL